MRKAASVQNPLANTKFRKGVIVIEAAYIYS